ncbi:superoxide dismutase, Fe-Mn family [Mariprofundus micogutta]|uniref:Superoxide dismutase n=1 Tax=Mariprofundus micogutta TaxID=1921010 RepID=A0A1L8CKG1_9PROT|nr:superoxide dismutase [Mariprofundus micogutta]GAV19404.1 superoxide dismutase, Fe-Mn family [Mariprofundus micogutta]
MAIELPALPYAKNALAPVISAETLEYHHDKHHAAYVTNLNKFIEDTEFADMSLEEIICSAPSGPIFNNAAQVWNHTFYFNGLSSTGGGEPGGGLADAISASFGSFAAFKEQMTASATGNFGSGWTWLVRKGDGGLEVVNTANAGCPLTDGKTPLLAIDVWEHAYYIDYRNARPQYLQAIWDIIDWDVVASK